MGSDPWQTIFQLNAAEQTSRTVICVLAPAPPHDGWVVNNPLHFRGELSALKG